eukprot:scaffold2234_cov211-Pinguiococcus_pyrenoidosus.AAC.2
MEALAYLPNTSLCGRRLLLLFLELMQAAHEYATLAIARNRLWNLSVVTEPKNWSKRKVCDS